MNNQIQTDNSKTEENMYIQAFNDHFSKYPQLLPFIYLDYSSESDKNQETKEKLLNFYTETVMQLVPTFYNSSENMIYFYSSDNLRIHTAIYLSHKIWKKRIIKYKEKVSIFSTLICVLHSFLEKHSENKIVIKYQKLINDFQNEDPLIKCLICFIHQIQLKSHLEQNFKPNKKKLYYMFVRDIAKYNEDDNIHCLQHVFEAAISKEQFIFYNEINSLIQGHKKISFNKLNSLINDISRKIGQHFGISNSKDLHILLISLLRYIYDQIYPSVFHIYFSNTSTNIFLKSSNIAFKQLHINIRLFPPSTRPSKPFRPVLRNDYYYIKAIKSLEEIQFMTNPLDMLYCIRRSLKFIEESARYFSHREISKPIDFHESVSIFLAVTLSSDIPEIIELHKFINDFFCDDVLFPELCAVRAALESCVTNLYELDKGNPIKKII